MPRKRKIANEEPIRRPQRNMRAKKVFDPSDNYLPKRRNKFPTSKSVQPIESEIKLKCKKKIKRGTKSKSSLVKYSNDCSPDENISTFVHSHCPSNSPVTPTEMPQAMSNVFCFLCTVTGDIEDLIDCPICFVKVHKDCLIIVEPTWKFKLDLNPWLCDCCREFHCCLCLKGDMDLELISCITCKVGLHSYCYDSCFIKHFEPIKDLSVFVCTSCVRIATKRLPEEKEEKAMQNILNEEEIVEVKEGKAMQKILNEEEIVEEKEGKVIQKILHEEERVEEKVMQKIINEEERVEKQEQDKFDKGETERVHNENEEENENNIVEEDENDIVEEDENDIVEDENDIVEEIEEELNFVYTSSEENNVEDRDTSSEENNVEGGDISSEEKNVEDGDNNSINSFQAHNSSSDFSKELTEVPNVKFPDVSGWDKYQMYEYFADRLPKDVLVKIMKYEIDGNAVQLLRRSDITSNMGLTLGNAMQFYKQVRIIQTQSLYHHSYWE